MTTLRVHRDGPGYAVELEADDGTKTDLAKLAQIRRWTVDGVLGDTPKLYVETVGDAALVVDGVEIVHNIIGAGVNGKLIAEWLNGLDVMALEAEALADAGYDQSLVAGVVQILAQWAEKEG